jgi:signal transduction histidine kinase/DNA-binding response OmpR family regulator/ligand-binding sensor domain-containing protein
MKAIKFSGLSKKFIQTLCLLFCIIQVSKNVVLAQQFPYKFQFLTVDEGLSHTDAYDIAQDKQGYIWVGTLFGINRFDGYSIKKYYNSNAPSINALKNRIRCICPDETGNIWLGTENGLQRFNSRTEKYTDFDDIQKINITFDKLVKPAGQLLYGLVGGQIKLFLIKENIIEEQRLSMPAGVIFSDIVLDQYGVVYLSSNKGLWTLDKNRKFRQQNLGAIADQNFSVVYFDRRHNLLTASCDKIFFISQQTLSLQMPASTTLIVDKEYSFKGKSCIKGIVEGNKADYWVTTNADLLRLDINSNLVRVLDTKHSLRNLNSNSIAKIFVDRTECLWVCTFGGGVNYCDLNEKLFYTLQHDPEMPNTLSGNHIRSVLEDGENLWIGTTTNGLNQYNLKTQKFQYFNTYNSQVRLKSDKITALVFDDDHNIWIGSVNGIEILRKGEKEILKPTGFGEFPTHSIGSLVKDCFGNIWFGNLRKKFGVIWKDKQNYYHVKYYEEGHFLFADKKKPLLFVSSTHGVKQYLIDEEGNIKKTVRYGVSTNGNSLSSDYSGPIVKQSDSVYWVGTIGGGLNRIALQAKTDSANIKTYASEYGVFNDVENLEIDNSGNIWMGGNGLECLDPITGKLIKYDKNDGLQGNSFKIGSSYKGADGKLYFGGIKGLNYFYPDQIKSNHIDAQPVLTDILINNQKPKYGDSTGDYVPEAISYSKELKLSYLQNNIVISFSSMHFANPLKCKYRYKLLGFDKDWKYTDGKSPNAAYSNLDYITYNFVVEATNNDEIWSKNQAQAYITISPPWWKSTLAKIIYALLIISALAGIYIYQARWYRLKRELEVRAVNEKKKEEIHKEREDLYQQQLTFFTNVSHDFRTPLNLIIGPLENLMRHNKSAVLDNSYQLMYRNTRRLINLISELMNLRKVADSVIKLHVQPLMIHHFCTDIANEFENMAISKNISFKLIDHTEDLNKGLMTGLFDEKILEKILFNLLNNAFKYTNEGGHVSLEMFFDLASKKPLYSTGFQFLNENTRAKKYLYFCVGDTGIGISQESISRVFDRYYRVSNEHLGSGVGLALVKSLTQLHRGDIYVYSEQHKGTEIIIGIPWGEENYQQSEKLISTSDTESQLEAIDNDIALPIIQDNSDQLNAMAKIQKKILLVEDNQELRLFLKQELKNEYFIYEAHDGNSGLQIATENVPDLIISDVMMPGMNGIEFCKRIKESFETSHIPFIILSAKEAVASQIEGLESGADYYFAKPLSTDLLLLTIHNIFEQDRKLKQRYAGNYLTEAIELVHTEKDKEFFHKLLNIIEENIQNADLDVDFLCENLYISRTKLYQKIKSITEQSVAEFIRTIRLKKAIQIMIQEEVSMNEVADRVGMQSGSNFSRVFKKEYEKSPMQYIQALKKSDNSSK